MRGEPYKPHRSRFELFLGRWWPVLLGMVPFVSFAMVFLIGSAVRWDGQGAILVLPFVFLIWLAPVIALLGFVMLVAKKEPRFFWMAILGVLGSGFLLYGMALAAGTSR